MVIAHRGSSSAEPEHTLAAYTRALGEGAHGVECDVRLTADSHLVCVHDRKVDRTSNGRGVVSTLELADLQGLDWGSWKQISRDAARDTGSDETEQPDRDRNHLLTLRRLLTTVVDSGEDVGVLVETKHPNRYAGLVERELARVLGDLGLDGRPREGEPWVQMMSFSQLAVQRMHQLCPQVRTVLLVEKSMSWRFREGLLPRGVRTVGLHMDTVRRSPATVARHREHGHEVYVWTVDDLDDARRCRDLGVDAIITNRPRDVMDALGGNG